MIVTAHSEAGPRADNQDAYHLGGTLRLGDEPVPDASRGRVVLMADGMGGAAAGEEASRAACDAAAREFYRCTADDPGLRLVSAFDAAHSQIRDLVREDPRREGMGTTLVALALDAPLPACQCGHLTDARMGYKPDAEAARKAIGPHHTPIRCTRYAKHAGLSRCGITVANVGDSRCYFGSRAVDGSLNLRQVTEDHSVVGKGLRRGRITAEQAARSPVRHVVTRAVGTRGGPPDVDVFQLSCLPGDVLILCSDGLWEALDEGRLRELLEDPAVDAERLVREALPRATDNATAVLVRV